MGEIRSYKILARKLKEGNQLEHLDVCGKLI